MINPFDLGYLKSNLPFWKNLNTIEQESIVCNSNTIHFNKGQVIHYGDIDCVGLLLIKSGTLRIYITSDEGREITLYRLSDNEICILSASCILNTIDFDVTVEADTDCDILIINSHTFAKLCSENVYAELFSYKLATTRFSEVMWTMQQILFTSFDKRLATFLIDECNKTKQDTLTITHDEIAKYLGSAREVVSRMLKYFSKEGYVSLSRGTVTITNKNALLSITSN